MTSDLESVKANGFIPADYEHDHDRLLVEGEHDLFGDGSVVTVPEFGHTPGHQGLMLRTAQGKILLAGDVCYLRETLDTLELPGIGYDPEGVLETLQKVSALRDEDTEVIIAHDPEFWDTVPQAPLKVC